MSILSAQSIRKYIKIEPFSERGISYGMSYGLSSCGYDLRFKSFGRNCYRTWPLIPGDFILACVQEKIWLPKDICAEVKDKSSWARKGLAVQNTVVEPGWFGYLTLELTNHGKEILYLEEGMPSCQILFSWLDQKTEAPYKGKYQNHPDKPVEAIWEFPKD